MLSDLSEFQHLRRRLKDSPLLLVDLDSGEAVLIDHDGANHRMQESGQKFGAVAVMDARNSLWGFARLIGEEDRAFRVQDVAKAAGVTDRCAGGWSKEAVLKPSISRGVYSWGDVFAAGLLGALSRQGVPRRLMCKVSRLIQQTVKSERELSTVS